MTHRKTGLVLYGCLLFSTGMSIGQLVGNLVRCDWVWAGVFAILLAVTLYATVSMRRLISEDAK